MSALRTAFLSTIVFATLVVTTVVFGFFAGILGWLPPRGKIMLFFARLWARCWLAVSGVRVEVETPAAVGSDSARGAIYLANHASWYDIPILLLTLPREVRFAAKRGLFQVPFLGWALHAGGFIPVDRGDKARAKDVFAAAIERLAEGSSVLFFPEGTRTPDGRLHRFQRGGFLLALKSGASIVPVGIEGTFEIMPRGALAIRPRPVTVSFGAPVDVEAYGLRGRKRLMEDVRRQIAALARAELAEPSPAAGSADATPSQGE